ncbi:adenine deaminase [Escherichia coli]|uniref:Adenine deaminase n=1 Tax=Escherichia coli TaxID=562 RepID=A0A376KKC8_ECOLX|nr:adenine deaminase [Escherichia coli]
MPCNLRPGKRYRVIDVIHNELITHSHSSVYSENGFDRDDVSFIAVLERYGQRLAPACGLLGGFGLNEGALAATVSHDSHNIVVIGRSAEEMALAVNQVIQDGGGLCVVRNGQVQSHLPLPIAGLMSTDTAQLLAEQIDALKAAARECGPLPDEPFIQMAFLSLPVIPALKLTSQGLFDGEKFAFTTLEVTE